MNSLISIIIPTYNSEKTVGKAIKSVQDQIFQDWECIIIDGNSKDSTLTIVYSLIGSDKRFIVISEPDNGIYDAFNKGWRLASSTWVYYLGSDDYLTKDGMSIIAPELDETYAVVSGDVYLRRVDRSVKEMLTNGFHGCHQGMLMQRHVIEEMGGFDERFKIIADQDLIERVDNAGYQAKNVRAFVAFFNANGTSQNLTAPYKIMKERYRVYKKNGYAKHPFAKAFSMFVVIHVSMIYRRIIRVFKRS